MNRINEIIKKSIIENIPNNFGKIGGIEASHLFHFLTTKRLELIRGNSLAVNAGIYVSTQDELEKWCQLTLESIKNLDYALEWCPEQGDKYVLDLAWKGKERFYSFEDIEPFFHEEDGWHYNLKNKKLLVISPFKDTILQQVNNYSKIWKNAEIGDVSVVRAPYPAMLTGEDPKCFLFHLERMKEEISKQNFDFATIGCGGYSLILLDYIKKMGKPCIHLGGGNQILFGIKGKRWDENQSFVKSKWYGKENWTSPLNHEVPKYKNLVENGCYW
jgi:hypothetical protein